MNQSLAQNIRKNHESQESVIEHMMGKKDELFRQMIEHDCASYQCAIDPLKYLDPFLSPNATWLTVGDYSGFEANYLEHQKDQTVTASDLSDAMLKEAKKEGLISNFSKQNVEQMTYADKMFDYVMCKETFHHFPRAYLGLYEMLRVSKKAAILVAEPIDILSKMASLMIVKNILDRMNPLLIGKIWKNRFSFEEAGNYVFKVSEREMEKVAAGIGLPFIAFRRHNIYATHRPPKGYNDVPMNRKVYKAIRRSLLVRDLISAVGVIPYGTLCSVLCTEQPSEDTINKMKKMGFTTMHLPVNPYLG